MKRVVNEPAYVLHRYPFSETSTIVELYTRHHGRVSVLAKGAKRPKSPLRAVLLPLQKIHISYSSQARQTQVHTLRTAEWQGGQTLPNGQVLLCGYYLNELLMRLLAREDPNEKVFDLYSHAISSLCQAAPSLPKHPLPYAAAPLPSTTITPPSALSEGQNSQHPSPPAFPHSQQAPHNTPSIYSPIGYGHSGQQPSPSHLNLNLPLNADSETFPSAGSNLHNLQPESSSLDLQGTLRAFELLLLRHIGVLPGLSTEKMGLTALQNHNLYVLQLDRGLSPPSHQELAHALSGTQWRELNQAMVHAHRTPQAWQACVQACAPWQAKLKPQLRHLLQHHCGVRTLQTRQLMVNLRGF